MEAAPDLRLIFEGATGPLEETWVFRVEFADRQVFVQYRAWHDGGHQISEAVPGDRWERSAPGRALRTDEQEFFRECVVAHARTLRSG